MKSNASRMQASANTSAGHNQVSSRSDQDFARRESSRLKDFAQNEQKSARSRKALSKTCAFTTRREKLTAPSQSRPALDVVGSTSDGLVHVHTLHVDPSLVLPARLNKVNARDETSRRARTLTRPENAQVRHGPAAAHLRLSHKH